MKAEGKVWRDLREGAYLLRTNLQADSAEEMWSKYMQRSRGLVSRAEERAFNPTFVPSEGAAGQGSCAGGFSRLRFMGDAEAFTQASTGDRAQAHRQRSGQCSTVLADEDAGFVVHTAKRRHCPAYHGWARDPHSSYYRTHGGTEIPASPARSKSSGTAEISFKM